MVRPFQETFDFAGNESGYRDQILDAARSGRQGESPITVARLYEIFGPSGKGWHIQDFNNRMARLVTRGRLCLFEGNNPISPDDVDRILKNPESWSRISAVRPLSLSGSDWETIHRICLRFFGAESPPDTVGASVYVNKNLRSWQSRLNEYASRMKTENIPGRGLVQSHLAVLRSVLLQPEAASFLAGFVREEAGLEKIRQTMEQCRSFFQVHLPAWRETLQALKRFVRNREDLLEDPRSAPAFSALEELKNQSAPPGPLDHIQDLISRVDRVNGLLEAKKTHRQRASTLSQISEMIQKLKKGLKELDASPDLCNLCLLDLRKIEKRIPLESDRFSIIQMEKLAEEACLAAWDRLERTGNESSSRPWRQRMNIVEPQEHELLILVKEPAPYLSWIEASNLPGLDVKCAKDPASVPSNQADMVFGEPALVAKIIGSLHRLKWVQSTFAGVEPLVGAGCRTDYVLTCPKGIFSRLMAEYVFAYLLAHEVDIFKTMANQTQKKWEPLHRTGLHGLCLGVCGAGSIGKRIAKTAKAFGMKVAVFKKNPEPVPEADQVFQGKDFHRFLHTADHVVSVLPHTPETAGIFNARAFSRMKKSALFINVGRGSAVDETALADALESGQIAGAVLDVFQKEPPDSASPLWTAPNLIITPHHSAVTPPRAAFDIFMDNFQRFITNRPLKYVVDFKQGY